MQSKATNQLDKQLQDLRKINENKKCFDCDLQGTNYVVPTVGIFVCQSCAGLHRDFHRVKGISVCSFTQQEIDLLTKVGNKNARNIWLATYKESDYPTPDRKDINRKPAQQSEVEVPQVQKPITVTEIPQIQKPIQQIKQQPAQQVIQQPVQQIIQQPVQQVVQQNPQPPQVQQQTQQSQLIDFFADPQPQVQQATSLTQNTTTKQAIQTNHASTSLSDDLFQNIENEQQQKKNAEESRKQVNQQILSQFQNIQQPQYPQNFGQVQMNNYPIGGGQMWQAGPPVNQQMMVQLQQQYMQYANMHFQTYGTQYTVPFQIWYQNMAYKQPPQTMNYTQPVQSTQLPTYQAPVVSSLQQSELSELSLQSLGAQAKQTSQTAKPQTFQQNPNWGQQNKNEPKKNSHNPFDLM